MVPFLLGLLMGMLLAGLFFAIAERRKMVAMDEKATAIVQVYEETISQIDETADYYVRLFQYIAKRLDDEAGRQQSS